MVAKGSSRHEDWKRLDGMVHGIRTAMLTTLDEAGQMRSRPMAPLDSADEGTLWFFTRRSAPKVDEIGHDRRVNVTFADPVSDRYVSVSGRAALVRDAARAIQLWSPALAAWFPAGPEDRDLALLRIDVESAEFWDPTVGRMARLFEAVRPVPAKPSDGIGHHHRRAEHAR